MDDAAKEVTLFLVDDDDDRAMLPTATHWQSWGASLRRCGGI